MKERFVFILILLTITSCKSPFEKEFRDLKPLELGDALYEIDSLESCKKKWLTKNIVKYHTSLNNSTKTLNSKDYYRETLKIVYQDYSNRYDDLVSEWQDKYDENLKIRSLIQVDTSYITTNNDNDLKIATLFKPNNEIEKVSFKMSYYSYYNFKNSVEPDDRIIDNDRYNLDGKVFTDTLTIIHTPTDYFESQYKSIGKNRKIKGRKKDKYDIDFTSIRINLLNGQILEYENLDEMPYDICIEKKE